MPLSAQETPLPILLVIGLSIVAGTAGARLFQYLRIPQVVGYIVMGLLLGATGLRILSVEVVERLRPFSYFALGVIGFMIGGELHRDVFRRYGRAVMSILVSEGISTFLAVGVLCTLALWWITGHGRTAAAAGLLLGAIASATAPAATVDVLWEYKARGPLTTTVFAIVAMDDALALVLYAISAGLAGRLLGQSSVPVVTALSHVGLETLGSIALGGATGFGLNFLLRRLHETDRTLALVIGVLALLVGVANAAGWDLILAALAMGATLANLAPRRSHSAFDVVRSFSTPLYVLFFVLVGARLNLRHTALWIWALAAVYVVGRSAGKWVGAWLGARWTQCPPSVRRYLGFCLFSQAGVAIGLSLMASESLADLPPIGSITFPTMILAVITATTFLVQIIGPPSVRWAIHRAGEAGLDVTEADLLRTLKAGDVAEPPVVFLEDQPLSEVLARIASSDHTAFPVVSAQGALTGVITMEDFRRSYQAQPLARWLLAYDLMQPPPDAATADQPLIEAMRLMDEQGLDYLPVVAGAKDRRPTGLLQKRAVQRRLSNELLRRRQMAETLPVTAAETPS